jgi:cytochrome b subunit of formate dehydrogenase
MPEPKMEFPGPGTAVFFAAAVAIFAAYNLKDNQAMFWATFIFAVLCLATGVAIEYTEKATKSFCWKQLIALILVAVAVAIFLLAVVVKMIV